MKIKKENKIFIIFHHLNQLSLYLHQDHQIIHQFLVFKHLFKIYVYIRFLSFFVNLYNTFGYYIHLMKPMEVATNNY
jgi:hypothetical protein